MPTLPANKYVFYHVMSITGPVSTGPFWCTFEMEDLQWIRKHVFYVISVRMNLIS